jgi:hypothetical protein
MEANVLQLVRDTPDEHAKIPSVRRCAGDVVLAAALSSFLTELSRYLPAVADDDPLLPLLVRLADHPLRDLLGLLGIQ